MLTMPLPLVESQPVLVLSPGCECCFVPRQKSVVSPRWSCDRMGFAMQCKRCSAQKKCWPRSAALCGPLFDRTLMLHETMRR